MSNFFLVPSFFVQALVIVWYFLVCVGCGKFLELLFIFDVHTPQIHTRQSLPYKTHTYKMYKFNSNMIVQVHFNRGFEGATFWLLSSCQGITFLTGFCISPINHFSLLGSQPVISGWTKTTVFVTGNLTQNVYVQLSWCAMDSFTSLSHQDPLGSFL